MSKVPYVVREELEDGHAVHVLEDRAARSEAWVVPDLGLNLYRFSVEDRDESVAIVDPPPTLADLRADLTGYGVPILFPFPGRIPEGRFAFGGRTYQLLPREGDPPYGHGFVLDRTWRVIGSGTSTRDGAVLAARFESEAFPELAAQWPSAFRLDVTYRLRAWTLTMEARAENVGREPLPVGYGLHPYLHAPIDRGSSVGGCVIAVPVTRRWELRDLVPTGRLLPLDEDLAAGVSLEGRTYDEVYTGPIVTRGESRSVLTDTRRRLSVVVAADKQFRDWVVYTPPRPAVCFEPWTCIPNAVNLQAQGIDAGLIVLQPGEWRSWKVRISAKRMG